MSSIKDRGPDGISGRMSHTTKDTDKKIQNNLRTAGRSFKILSVFEKAITIIATITTGILTLGIAAPFTFRGLTNYFANKKVTEIKADDSSTQDPSVTKTAKTFQTIKAGGAVTDQDKKLPTRASATVAPEEQKQDENVKKLYKAIALIGTSVESADSTNIAGLSKIMVNLSRLESFVNGVKEGSIKEDLSESCKTLRQQLCDKLPLVVLDKEIESTDVSDFESLSTISEKLSLVERFTQQVKDKNQKSKLEGLIENLREKLYKKLPLSKLEEAIEKVDPESADEVISLIDHLSNLEKLVEKGGDAKRQRKLQAKTRNLRVKLYTKIPFPALNQKIDSLSSSDVGDIAKLSHQLTVLKKFVDKIGDREQKDLFNAILISLRQKLDQHIQKTFLHFSPEDSTLTPINVTYLPKIVKILDELDVRVDELDIDGEDIESLRELYAIMHQVNGIKTTLSNAKIGDMRDEIASIDTNSLKPVEAKLKAKIAADQEIILKSAKLLQQELQKKESLVGQNELIEGINTLRFIFNANKEIFNIDDRGRKGEEIVLDFAHFDKLFDPLKPKGIRNLGQSCYMNSNLQMLMIIPGMIDLIKADKTPQCAVIRNNLLFQISRSEEEFKAINTLFNKLDALDDDAYRDQWKSSPEIFWTKHKSIVPKELLLKQKSIEKAFADYYRYRRVHIAAKDFIKAHESARKPDKITRNSEHLRDALVATGLLETRGNFTEQKDAAEAFDIISDTFCLKSGIKAVRKAEVEGKPYFLERQAREGNLKLEVVGYDSDNKLVLKSPSLQGILDNYFKPKKMQTEWDILTEGGGVVKTTEHEESFVFDTLPDTLTIQLKRFAFDPRTGQQKKIKNPLEVSADCIVELPGKYKRGGEKSEKVRYRIVAAINHHGNSPKGGHYTAAVYRNGQWFQCDDTITKPLSNPSDKLSNGYLFVLQKV